MNKISKTAMYMAAGGMIAGLSYYAGLPKSKKNAVKDEIKNMMKMEKDAVLEYFD